MQTNQTYTEYNDYARETIFVLLRHFMALFVDLPYHLAFTVLIFYIFISPLPSHSRSLPPSLLLILTL